MMARIGDLQYKVACLMCGSYFLVDNLSDGVPKHPPKGEKVTPGEPYLPCAGSNQIGRPVDVKIKGYDT